ncbi:hypothetical protein Lalb_Chr15g0085111 [Lupinus albus]|uniref:Uncharacterized protein n=1 Tax=Lupinus albus TaxID=3870 RepID=A0A6A4P7G7_LUPAL|nr:hypothetical protein Lalb_Chr15g0085111 [Lupinus albus]
MENEITVIKSNKNMKKKIGPEMYLGVLFSRYVGFLADASIILPHLDRHFIEGLQEQDIGSVKCSVFRSWLNYLPLTNDAQEARKVHAQLSTLLQRYISILFVVCSNYYMDKYVDMLKTITGKMCTFWGVIRKIFLRL